MVDIKYPSILFACGFAILTFKLYALDNVSAQAKSYDTFEDFLEEVQNTAYSLVDYVSKIQALFCPNQPICGPEGELSREEVLETLPETVTVNGLTVALDDIPDYAGVCCLPCSCSENCDEDGNCCPSKQLDQDKNGTAMAKKECIAATIHSYKKADINTFYSPSVHDMFLMITDCFQEVTNSTPAENCRTPNATSFGGDVVPVTSLKTGTNYWNRACAICNNDNDDVIDWSPVISMKLPVPYFKNSTVPGGFPGTYDHFLELVSSIRFGDIVYQPPLPMINSVCLGKAVIATTTFCETSSMWLRAACQKLHNPVYLPRHARQVSFMNIFCLVCQNTLKLRKQELECRYLTDIRGRAGPITAILNYKRKPEVAGPVGRQNSRASCNCDEIFDPYQKMCRTKYCPFGDFRVVCECFPALQNYSGMPILMKVKLTSKLNTNVTLNERQLKQLQTALTQKVEVEAKHSSAEVILTYRQENIRVPSYLSILIMRTDPGHDTKTTLASLMKYLDTDEELEVRARQVPFSAVLTTRIALWSEEVHATNKLTFQVRDMKSPSITFANIYTNDKTRLEIRRGQYQVLSRLLYCTQVQLNNAEYFERSGLIIVNVTSQQFAISDYYKIPPTREQVRVCADEYLKVSNGTRKASEASVLDRPSYLGILIAVIVALETLET